MVIYYEKFDVFSFIDFALVLNENGLYYFYEDELAFKIKITENFRDIQIYVKNLMNRFDYKDIE